LEFPMPIHVKRLTGVNYRRVERVSVLIVGRFNWGVRARRIPIGWVR
jgi:hypothetical protein